ncbi:MAG: hypothetical protein ACOX2M_03845 [Fastidiosipilaceae bacterium]|jgi:hypothetical protein
MEYTYTAKCGHSCTVDLVGTQGKVFTQLQRLSKEDCKDCRDEAFEKMCEADVSLGWDWDLVEMFGGSYRQTIWGAHIRMKFARHFGITKETCKFAVPDQMILENNYALEHFAAETMYQIIDAEQWINNRDPASWMKLIKNHIAERRHVIDIETQYRLPALTGEVAHINWGRVIRKRKFYHMIVLGKGNQLPPDIWAEHDNQFRTQMRGSWWMWRHIDMIAFNKYHN